MNHGTHKRMAVVVGTVISACNQVAESRQTGAQALERVELKRVCMANDTAFDRDLIPVNVGDATYYGCCKACEGRLKKEKPSASRSTP